jgi:hypothetical protein
MPHRNYLIRQAAWLFRFAQETRDPEVATVLLAKAADLNEQLSAPGTDASLQAPDVEPERGGRFAGRRPA